MVRLAGGASIKLALGRDFISERLAGSIALEGGCPLSQAAISMKGSDCSGDRRVIICRALGVRVGTCEKKPSTNQGKGSGKGNDAH